MTTYALRLENGTDTAARMRLGDLLTLPAGAAPLTAKSGIRADGGGVVTVTTGSMNVNVSPLMGWIQGGVSVVQGGYTFVSDSTVTLAIAAGHASLSRTDTVAAVVRDNAFDSSGQVKAEVVVIAGTPGAGAPTLPTNSLPLRDIVVPAGLSAGNGGLTGSNLGTDRRVYLGDPAPYFHARRDGGATGTPVAWNSVEDTESGFSTSTNTYTIKRAGVYRISVQLKGDGNGSGAGNNLQLYKNGSASAYLTGNNGSAAAFSSLACYGYTARFALNDALRIYTTIAFTLQSDSPAENSWWTIEYVRP